MLKKILSFKWLSIYIVIMLSISLIIIGINILSSSKVVFNQSVNDENIQNQNIGNQNIENSINENKDTDVQNNNLNYSKDEQDEEVIRDCYENRIALTFDDGPGGSTTEKLLDGLKERGVKATFFLIGENVEEYPELVKRISDEGHLIGNHTFSHIQLSTVNINKAKDEIVKTNEAICAVTGSTPLYIRPPYGSYSDKLLAQINMTEVLWTIDPKDWDTDNVGNIVKCVVNNAHCGDIILLHDIYDSSVVAALEIVDELKAKGFVFVTVDQIILD